MDSDLYEDGICLLCGEAAIERYWSDCRETSYTCYCDLRKKYEEAQNTIKVARNIAEKRDREIAIRKEYEVTKRYLTELEKKIAKMDERGEQ
jgi:hypothetical protein